jgi:hypothetical protein
MDREQLNVASLRTDSMAQESKDFELPTSSPPSEDEMEGKGGKSGSTPSSKVKIKLAVKSPNKKEIEEAGAILAEMKGEADQDENNKMSLAGRFKEEFGPDEVESLRVKVERVEDNSLAAASTETGDALYLQGRLSTRSIASSLSPYSQVILKPSWETSEAYHR